MAAIQNSVQGLKMNAKKPFFRRSKNRKVLLLLLSYHTISRAMKNLQYGLLFFALLALSCEQSQQHQTETAIETVVREVRTDGPAKSLAHLSIEGMGCEMACGSAIKKALNGLDGVIITEINYEGDRDVNFAVVEFDESKLGSEHLADAVNNLRKGHYSVSAISLERHIPAGESASQDEGTSTEGKTSGADRSIETRSITIPNLLDVLNTVLR